MIQKSTYKILVELSADINRQVNESLAFAAFNRQQITNFYKHNKKSLEVSQKTFKELKEKFQDKEIFLVEMAKFLDQSVDIYL